MSDWIPCKAEGREHQYTDFTSKAIYSNDNKIIGHNTECRYCGMPIGLLLKNPR